jgi:hypothetical protein
MIINRSLRSRDSSVGTVTDYRLDGQDSNPGKHKYFSLHKVRTSSGAHSASYPADIMVNFPEDKAAGVWRSPLTYI